jgi:Heterokaryon incompatibility protein (HET)
MIYSLPLDPSKRQIRLPSLNSSVSKETPLNCTLRTVSLTRSLEYTALSYFWGDENTRAPININGETTSITTNLDTALRNLWEKEGEEVSVWADGVCINQADYLEKESQVRMMGDVYSNGKFSPI